MSKIFENYLTIKSHGGIIQSMSSQQWLPDYTLSSRERQVLYHLSLNGRASLTELGSRVGLSKQAVSYILNRLETSGVISAYYSVIDIYRLGMTHYRVFLKLHKIKPHQEDELRKYLSENPRISWVLYLDGEFDLFFVVWSRNISEFQEVLDDVIARFGHFFQEKSFSIATHIEYLPYGFLLDPPKPPERSLHFGSFHANYELSNVDRRLLMRLNRNGRATQKELAALMGLSPSTVRNRIQRLHDRGIIIGYNVRIDFARVGYMYQKVLLKLTDTSAETISSLREYLKGQPGVIYLLRTIGPYDFEFELITRSGETGYDIIKDLRLRFPHAVHSAGATIIKGEPKFESLYLESDPETGK